MKLALAAAVLLVGLVSAIYLFVDANRVGKARDFEIETRYEGSHTENLGLITTITADAKRRLNAKTGTASVIEEAREETAEALLRNIEQVVRSEVSAASKRLRLGEQTGLPSGELGFIQQPESMASLLLLPEAAGLQLEHFGLVGREVRSIDSRPRSAVGAYYLETSFREVGERSSFVFVPASLVIQDTAPNALDSVLDLSPRIKRELILSKLLELVIRDAAHGFEDALKAFKAQMIYFIPPSGLTRIVPLERRPAEYSGYLEPVSSLSDRTYFKNSSETAGGFYTSEPYFDGVGRGLVLSYCLYLRFPELALEGMLVIDRQLMKFEELWSGFGEETLAGFVRYEHEVGTGLPESLEGDLKGPLAEAIDWIEANQQEATSGIERPSVLDRELFTVPMGPATNGKDQVGIYYRNPRWWTQKRSLRLLFFVLSLLSLVGMVIMAQLALRALRRAERQQVLTNRLHTGIVQGLHGGFVIASEDLEILEANEKFGKIVGDDDAVGCSLDEFLTAETVTELREGEAAVNGGGFEIPGATVNREAGTAPTIIASAPVEIPLMPNARMLIIIPSSELEVTIGSKFLHSFSHALKTPAHSIMLLAQALRRKKNYKNFEKNLSLLNKEINEFSGLIGNILQFSELELKDVEIKQELFDLTPILRGPVAIAQKRIQAESKEVRVACSAPKSLPIYGDREMIKIVLNNLVDNAVKYTDSGSIHLRAVNSAEKVRIEVRDTGIGIQDKDRADVFKLFFRSDDPNVRSRDGLGIGLHVSKRYVELHGGALALEPESAGQEEEQGSIFVVTLPGGSVGRQAA